MPNAVPQKASAQADQKLSQLIRLKRLERPDAAFWTRFEQEYRSKQLSSLVQVQPLSTRIFRACRVLARKAAPPATAFGAIALTVFAANNFAYLAENAGETSPAQPSVQTAERVEASVTPLFVVQQPPPPAREADPASETGTVYQMNVLTHRLGVHEAYEVNATPVTFTSQQVSPATGVKVISSQPDY